MSAFSLKIKIEICGINKIYDKQNNNDKIFLYVILSLPFKFYR